MDFGDSSSLRSLASQLSSDADDTGELHARISHSVAGLAGSVSKYEVASAERLQGRWADVGSVIDRLADDSTQLAAALRRAADELDDQRHVWDSTASQARGEGCTVYEGFSSATVTPPASQPNPHPTAADTAHDQQQADSARAHEDRMNGAAHEAMSARDRLRAVVGGLSTSGYDALRGSQTAYPGVRTGDPSLDQELDRVAGSMLAVHDNLSRTA